MKCPYCIKICTKCGRLLVANTMNFNKKQGGKYNLRSDCKNCVCERNRNHRQKHKDEYKQKDKERYEKKKSNFDYMTKKNEYDKKYREEHKEEAKEYYEKNKEKLLEYKKQWRKENPNKIFNYNNKRRQLEEQGNGITKEQWLEMMNFFDWCCAYSGEYIGGKQSNNIRSIDHIIPLNLNGENEVWNCVPSHVFYNKSKHDKNMLEWYILQPFYTEERLNKIYEWIKYAEEKYKK